MSTPANSNSTQSFNNLPINILYTTPHTSYCDAIRSIKERRRALLLAIQSLAHIRDTSKSIQTAIASCTNAHVNINAAIKIFAEHSPAIKDLFNDISETLTLGAQWEIEQDANKICKILTAQLKLLPAMGHEAEIAAAETIANTYLQLTFLDNVPTQPNSPKRNLGDKPIFIPPPIHTTSHVSETVMSEASSTEDCSDLGLEVQRLVKFLATQPAYMEPTTFAPPTGYHTMIKGGENDPDHWHQILLALIDAKGTMGQYRGNRYRYAVRTRQLTLSQGRKSYTLNSDKAGHLTGQHLVISQCYEDKSY